MARKNDTIEEIVAKLRQLHALVSQGEPGADAVQQIRMTEVTCYLWRKEYGGPEAGPG